MNESKLFQNTVCLAVTFHGTGATRRLKDVVVRKEGATDEKQKADQRRVRANKQIFDSETYRDLGRIGHQFEVWARRRALASPLRRRTYLIPLGYVDEFYAKIAECEASYAAKADALCSEYEDLKKKAKEDLKELFDENDYYSVSRLRRAFWVERRMFDFSPPGETKLSEEIYRQEKERWSNTFREAEVEVLVSLREACRDLVAHLVDKLTPSEDGKKKVLKDSAVEKVIEFFDLFEKRNVLNDEELKKLVTYGRRVMSGEPDVLAYGLRKDENIRDVVREQMTKVKVKLDKLVEEAPARAVSFDDDEF